MRQPAIWLGVVLPFAISILLIATPIYCGVWLYGDLVDAQPSWDFWVFPPITLGLMAIVTWAFAGLLIACAWRELQGEIHCRRSY